LIAERKGYIERLKLNIEIIDWASSNNLSDLASGKKMEFINWLNQNYPNININNHTEWEIFWTYPQHIIVEHYTLLNNQYELRICCHAMIPPHDWSMIRLRERNTFTAFLSARQDTKGGLIYQIPITEYPLLYGY